MNMVYRQWLILRMIPRHGRITVSGIFERLAGESIKMPSRRSIERDLELLSGLFPITCDIEGRTNYWYWPPDAPLMDIPGMDLHTSLAFDLLNRYTARLLPRATRQKLEPYIANAAGVLANIDSGNLSVWPDKVRVVNRSIQMESPDIDQAVLSTVSEALFSEQCIRITYRKRNHDKEKDYDLINPLGLVFVDNLIYLVATVGDYADALQFLLHRMVSARKLDLPARKPAGFSLQRYIDKGEFSYPDGQMIRLKALFDEDAAAYLHETPLPGTRRIRVHSDDRILLEADVQDSRQLRWWLKGFGDQVEIVEPEALRKEFAAMAGSLQAMYAGKS